MQEESPAEKVDFSNFRCPGCSAGIQFDPETQAMKCSFCGTVTRVEDLQEESIENKEAEEAGSDPEGEERDEGTAEDGIPMNPLFSALEGERSSYRRFSLNALQVDCRSCGSSITFEPPDSAGLCPFCGLALVVEATEAEAQLPPDAILPMQITQEQSKEQIRRWLKARWFAPNALRRLAETEALQGVYLPYWSYDTDTSTSYQGECGVYYYVTEYYYERDSAGNSVRRSREVRKTHWRSVSGSVNVAFENLRVAATRSIPIKRLAALEPWAIGKLERYDPAYLAGFKSQRAQVSLGEGFNVAQRMMEPRIVQAIRQDIGGDVQRIYSTRITYDNAYFLHLLLPLWIGTYRFKGKPFQVIVNATTGEVQGQRPYSIWKIALLVYVIVMLMGWLLDSWDKRSHSYNYHPPAPITTPMQTPKATDEDSAATSQKVSPKVVLRKKAHATAAKKKGSSRTARSSSK